MVFGTVPEVLDGAAVEAVTEAGAEVVARAVVGAAVRVVT